MNPRSSERDATVLLEHDGQLLLYPDAFADDPKWLDELTSGIDWQQHRLRLFGREVMAPRLSAWHGDAGCYYRYSGLRLAPQPLTPLLQRMRSTISDLTGVDFNCVLLNLYRDGADSMGWHADDEPELGADPDIGSVSLGATRRFLLRHRRDRSHRLGVDLEHGSLLVMKAPMQRHWQHSVPKTRRVLGPRLNLTWRVIR